MNVKSYLLILIFLIAFGANIPALAFQNAGQNQSVFKINDEKINPAEISNPESFNYQYMTG